MLQFVLDCEETTWNRYFEAGQQYLKSPAIRAVQSDAFGETVLAAIDTVIHRA